MTTANLAAVSKVSVADDRYRADGARPGPPRCARRRCRRALAPNPVLARLTAATLRALQRTPVSVRITVTD
ncbi:hypothetical protein ACTWPB_05410 [Nocardia sp. IBHARD005]|uniref:hypothetical protein n=1 Tax=Nocardia sp. IBHARD005 TaxID=3457765 RepID=UPI00405A49BC